MSMKKRFTNKKDINTESEQIRKIKNSIFWIRIAISLIEILLFLLVLKVFRWI